MSRKAVVLLSGGLDSTTCLAMAKAQGFEPTCLLIAYGQRHAVELERAKKVAQAMGDGVVDGAMNELAVTAGTGRTIDVATGVASAAAPTKGGVFHGGMDSLSHREWGLLGNRLPDVN